MGAPRLFVYSAPCIVPFLSFQYRSWFQQQIRDKFVISCSMTHIKNDSTPMSPILPNWNRMLHFRKNIFKISCYLTICCWKSDKILAQINWLCNEMRGQSFTQLPFLLENPMKLVPKGQRPIATNKALDIKSRLWKYMKWNWLFLFCKWQTLWLKSDQMSRLLLKEKQFLLTIN